jgi:hypothetical protein
MAFSVTRARMDAAAISGIMRPRFSMRSRSPASSPSGPATDETPSTSIRSQSSSVSSGHSWAPIGSASRSRV